MAGYGQKLPRQMTLTNRWRNGSCAFQTPQASINRNPGQPRDFLSQCLVETIPAQLLGNFSTDGAGARAKLVVNEKKLFHIFTNHHSGAHRVDLRAVSS